MGPWVPVVHMPCSIVQVVVALVDVIMQEICILVKWNCGIGIHWVRRAMNALTGFHMRSSCAGWKEHYSKRFQDSSKNLHGANDKENLLGAYARKRL